MILDQRHMTGQRSHETREQVIDAWDEHARQRVERGFEPFPLAPGRGERRTSQKQVVARIDASRWVADCPGGPTGNCRGGIACWPEHEKACCLDCGTVYTVKFPPRHVIAEAEEALLVRPPDNRHWRPEDETPEQLRHENIEHGYAPRGEPDWKTELAAKHGITPGLVDEILESAKRSEQE